MPDNLISIICTYAKNLIIPGHNDAIPIFIQFFCHLPRFYIELGTNQIRLPLKCHVENLGRSSRAVI